MAIVVIGIIWPVTKRGEGEKEKSTIFQQRGISEVVLNEAEIDCINVRKPFLLSSTTTTLATQALGKKKTVGVDSGRRAVGNVEASIQPSTVNTPCHGQY
jgi:hypothetical protein